MIRRALLFLIALLCCPAAGAALPAGAAQAIAKINGDWGPAMQRGDADTVAAAYAKDAVFCGADGACITGHDAILSMTRQRFSAHGVPKRATAHSTAMVEDRGYIYEWGTAAIMSAAGKTAGGGYLTVWRKQPDGRWLIERNLVLP